RKITDLPVTRLLAGEPAARAASNDESDSPPRARLPMLRNCRRFRVQEPLWRGSITSPVRGGVTSMVSLEPREEMEPRITRITRIRNTRMWPFGECFPMATLFFFYPCYPCNPWFHFFLGSVSLARAPGWSNDLPDQGGVLGD